MSKPKNKKQTKIRVDDNVTQIIVAAPNVRRPLPPPTQFHKDRKKEADRKACRKKINETI